MSSEESTSKNTRSPTLTTKSCWLPGVAALAFASAGIRIVRMFFAQAPIAERRNQERAEFQRAEVTHDIRHSGASILTSLPDMPQV